MDMFHIIFCKIVLFETTKNYFMFGPFFMREAEVVVFVVVVVSLSMVQFHQTFLSNFILTNTLYKIYLFQP